ncbi:hypothetical protein KAT59_02635 [Candidatus Bipolaricaulota bacterium]|nr:hypothetical protein [Candidatus Bipolaricaulota bacterium]
MAVVLPLITLGMMGLMSEFNCVTIRVTVTSLLAKDGGQSQMDSFCIW